MPDETPQPTSESVSSELSAPSEPTEQASIQSVESTPAELPPIVPETTLNTESTIPVTNDIPANEPLGPTPVAEIPNEPNNPNITIEKHGNDVTITEVMEPTAHSEPATAQMAGNEPLAKLRKENLEKANLTRQNKKRKKIDAILDLFAKQINLTNDEVEKLLHVSDATATRYLETLEKKEK